LASDHAAKNGNINNNSEIIPCSLPIVFNTEYNTELYRVEAPDAIGAIGGSKTFLRYSENLYSAGTAYKEEYGSVVLGFPFETINSSEARDELMKSILQYLKIK
jgi:carbamoylphosphate synthase large subunit